MTKDYKPFMQRALRQVIRDILRDVARQGLDGDSHYFITFQTDRSDVQIPTFIRSKYPKEISIILHNQFSGLIVNDESFSVDLTFGGVLSTLTIPYRAILTFADPAAQFVLTLDPEKAPCPVSDSSSEEIIDLTSLRSKKQ